MNNVLINDIEKNLNIKLNINNIKYYTDGATTSLVFQIDNKYLIKTTDELTYKTQLEFLNTYKNNYFQKIIYSNKKLSYFCFEYIEGEKIYNVSNLDINDIIKQLYNITSSYKKYNHSSYGYLYSDINKSWFKFLYDEVIYSKKEIESISLDKVIEALNIIKKYNIEKYLIHGDFGTHNFLIKDNKIKVIDPMSVVGDYLYDFYFACFSDPIIFINTTIENILSFYNYDLEYKKALLTIVIYIRMSRANKYNIKSFNKYLELYNNI